MTTELHDAVVQHVARMRFPFPGQTTWPADYVTIVNAPEPKQGIETAMGRHIPDILIVDGAGRTREIGEVELTVDPSTVARLKAASEVTDRDTPTGVHHFFVYVPAGLEREAQQLLDDHAISYAGVRGFTRTADGQVSIVPFVTTGDPYDHQ